MAQVCLLDQDHTACACASFCLLAGACFRRRGWGRHLQKRLPPPDIFLVCPAEGPKCPEPWAGRDRAVLGASA